MRSIFLIVFFFPLHSYGYNRSQTCISAEERAERGTSAPSNAPPCQGNQVGHPFRWNTNQLTYVLHEDLSSQFPDLQGQRDAFLQEIHSSFAQWQNVACSSLHFEFGGMTSAFGQRIDQQNWVGFYDTQDWPHSNLAVAVTTVTTLPDGTITDADIEINSKTNALGIDGEPTKYDVKNFLTHEIGHTFGLDHSGVVEATMQFQTLEGQTYKRTLHADDEAGICEIYPVDFEPVEENEGCCSTTRHSDASAKGLWFLFLIAFAGLRRRQRS